MILHCSDLCSLLGHILLLVDPWFWMRWIFRFREKSFLEFLHHYSRPCRPSKATFSNRLLSDHTNGGWPLPSLSKIQLPSTLSPSDVLIPRLPSGIASCWSWKAAWASTLCIFFLSSVYSNAFCQLSMSFSGCSFREQGGFGLEIGCCWT